MKLLTALNRSLKGVILDDRDQAAVELARTYARIIDKDEEHVMTWRYGVRFLDVLGEMGMTPKSRASVLHRGRMKGGDDDDGDDKSTSALDKLRNRSRRAAS